MSSCTGLFVFKKELLFSFFQIGFIKNEESVFLFVGGRYGEKYDAPNDCKFDNRISCMNIPKLIPKKPAIYPKIIYINRNVLIVKFNEKSGIAYEQIPVTATIIISRGVTKLADTAASPRIKPPIIPIVEPIGAGTLKLASLISSNEISIIKSSTITGNGMERLIAEIANTRSVGRSS